MGGMIVCDKVCLTVVSTSSLLSCDKGQFSLVDEIPGAGRKELPTEFFLELTSLGR